MLTTASRCVTHMILAESPASLFRCNPEARLFLAVGSSKIGQNVRLWLVRVGVRHCCTISAFFAVYSCMVLAEWVRLSEPTGTAQLESKERGGAHRHHHTPICQLLHLPPPPPSSPPCARDPQIPGIFPVTLTTVGYGDLSAHKTGTKLFACFYILIGVAMVAAFLARLVDFLLNEQVKAPTHSHTHPHTTLVRTCLCIRSVLFLSLYIYI